MIIKRLNIISENFEITKNIEDKIRISEYMEEAVIKISHLHPKRVYSLQLDYLRIKN
jgi:hypothetical protein